MPTENLDDELLRGVSMPSFLPAPPESRSLRERVTHWLVSKQFGTVKYVNQDVANARAKLAADCPFNKVNYADSCLECYQSTLRGLVAIRQGRTTPYDELLGACENCGWDNKTVVHLDISCLSGRSKDGCWCSQIDENTDKELV